MSQGLTYVNGIYYVWVYHIGHYPIIYKALKKKKKKKKLRLVDSIKSNSYEGALHTPQNWSLTTRCNLMPYQEHFMPRG